MKNWKEKVCLVVGASGGIGRAAAIAFAKKGATVVVAGRRDKEHRETVSAIESHGARALYVKTNIRDASQVQRLLARTIDRFRRLDCAFNNAGVFGENALLHDLSDENVGLVLDTNLRGTWLCMKYEIMAMLAGGTGTIVNCSSVSGLRGHMRSAIYSATKHGINGLTKSAALQYAKKGLRVNAVCPGSTDTSMLRATYATPQALEDRMRLLPGGRFGTCEEVADVVVWLASEESSFVNGHCLPVDGGLTASRGPEGSVERKRRVRSRVDT